jgi:hypothetical protein
MEQTEFDAMMDDADKTIDGDISWQEDEDHSPAVEFRVEVRSSAGYPLSLNGRYNPLADTLSYTLIHRSAGRVYALDLGADHHNPTCSRVGETHKHRWTSMFRDKEAYKPKDITADATQPVAVWQEFCREAKIDHRGVLHPPAIQTGLGP